MAIVAPVINTNTGVVTWSNMQAGDVGGHVANLGLVSPYGALPFNWTRVQFQVSGTLGVGGALRVDGSTTGVGFLPIQDAITAWPFFQSGIIWRPCGWLRLTWPPGGDDKSWFYAARLSVIDEVAPSAPEGVALQNFLRPRVIAGTAPSLVTLAATFITW